MSRVRPPDNIEIAALKQKKEVFFDAMAAGPGTPWEDRGTHGTVSAFFKTCAMSLTSFFKLVDSIRRPETTTDATGFLIGCCVLWGISAFVHGLIFLVLLHRVPNIEVYDQQYVIYCAIAAIGAGGGLFLLFKLYNLIYGKLIAQEKSASVLPAVLLFNVNAYALGPSLMAPIPVIGPVLAILGIFKNLVTAGSRRLNIRFVGAFIDALLAFIIVIVAGYAGYKVGNFVVHQVLGDTSASTLPIKVQ